MTRSPEITRDGLEMTRSPEITRDGLEMTRSREITRDGLEMTRSPGMARAGLEMTESLEITRGGLEMTWSLARQLEAVGCGPPSQRYGTAGRRLSLARRSRPRTQKQPHACVRGLSEGKPRTLRGGDHGSAVRYTFTLAILTVPHHSRGALGRSSVHRLPRRGCWISMITFSVKRCAPAPGVVE
eukprot:scaffold141402_cov133-Phaeocystis_antarctica.AAC.1